MKTCDKCWGTGKLINQAELGTQAYAARVERCESLEAAAKRLGISAPYLSLLENGKRHWPQDLFRKALQ